MWRCRAVWQGSFPGRCRRWRRPDTTALSPHWPAWRCRWGRGSAPSGPSPLQPAQQQWLIKLANTLLPSLFTTHTHTPHHIPPPHTHTPHTPPHHHPPHTTHMQTPPYTHTPHHIYTPHPQTPPHMHTPHHITHTHTHHHHHTTPHTHTHTHTHTTPHHTTRTLSVLWYLRGFVVVVFKRFIPFIWPNTEFFQYMLTLTSKIPQTAG